jgi:hypothetical protein
MGPGMDLEAEEGVLDKVEEEANEVDGSPETSAEDVPGCRGSVLL